MPGGTAILQTLKIAGGLEEVGFFSLGTNVHVNEGDADDADDIREIEDSVQRPRRHTQSPITIAILFEAVLGPLVA